MGSEMCIRDRLIRKTDDQTDRAKARYGYSVRPDTPTCEHTAKQTELSRQIRSLTVWEYSDKKTKQGSILRTSNGYLGRSAIGGIRRSRELDH